MISIRAFVVMLCVLFGLSMAAPGGWGGQSSHHVRIIVPYKVHTVHHHHVSKIHVPVHVPVPVPVIKKVIVPVETHHDVHHHDVHHHDDWHGGWW